MIYETQHYVMEQLELSQPSVLKEWIKFGLIETIIQIAFIKFILCILGYEGC